MMSCRDLMCDINIESFKVESVATELSFFHFNSRAVELVD